MAKGKKTATKYARNFHACHPIMKKGGVQEKSRGAKRAAEKRATRQKVSDHLGRSPRRPVLLVILLIVAFFHHRT